MRTSLIWQRATKTDFLHEYWYKLQFWQAIVVTTFIVENLVNNAKTWHFHLIIRTYIFCAIIKK